MAGLSCYAMDSHVFLTIFTAYQCKVHRVVSRKVHPSLLSVGKKDTWATKFPHGYCTATSMWAKVTPYRLMLLKKINMNNYQLEEEEMAGPKSTQRVVGIITDKMHPYTFFIETPLLENLM